MDNYIASLSNEQKKIFDAVKNYRISDVDIFLNESPNLIQDTVFSYVLLITALYQGYHGVYMLLVEKGCSVTSSFKTLFYSTPLYYAISYHDLKLCEELHKRGASIYDKDANSRTPIEALMKTSYQCFRYFTSKLNFDDLDPECRDHIEIFHVACYRGDLDIMKKFVERGFSANSRSGFQNMEWVGATPLHFAFQSKSRVEAVNLLLKLDVDFDIQDKRGNTILHAAFDKLDRKSPSKPSDPLFNNIMQAYIRKYDGTKFNNPVNKYGISHFHILCLVDLDEKCGNDPTRQLNLIKLFIEKGIDLNSTNTYKKKYMQNPGPYFSGYTGLHFAARYSRLSILKSLLENGADPTKVDSSGNENTPLHVLDFENTNSSQMAELLLKHGASVDVSNCYGHTPLHIAFNMQIIIDDHYSLELQHKLEPVMQVLSSASSQVSNIINAEGISYLHIAASRDLNLVKTLIGNGALINPPIEQSLLLRCTKLSSLSTADRFYQYSAFHIAIIFNRVEIVEYFLASGVDVNSKTNELETTPLHLACCEQLRNIQKSYSDGITEKSAKNIVNIEDSKESNGIEWNKNRKDQIQIIEMLIKHGADVNAQDYMKLTPLFAVSDLILSMVMSHPYISYKSSAYEEVLNRQKTIIDILINHGADVDCRDKSGKSLLHTLFETSQQGDKRKDIAKFLLDRGANIEIIDAEGYTPLNFAVKNATYYDDYDEENIYKNDSSFIDLFLEYGADINSKSNDLDSPLHTAVRYYHRDKDRQEILVKLLDHPDINLNSQNKFGKTPLHLAINWYKLFCVEKLLDAGVDVNIEDVLGEPPISHLSKRLKRPFYDQSSNKTSVYTRIIDYINKLIRINYFVSDKVRSHFSSIVASVELDFSLGLPRMNSKIDEELLKSKSVKIDSYTSLFQILMKHANEMAKHSKNENFAKMFVLSKQSSQTNECTNVFDYLMKDMKETANHAKKEMLAKFLSLEQPDSNDITSLFQFLQKDANERAEHARKFSKIESYQQLQKEFPHIVCFLKAQYKKGLSRTLLLDPAIKALRIVTKMDWPDSCSERILRLIDHCFHCTD
ncbi:hypothetical protein QAD02_006342 [Eretmocerus hayati]|uniref:Uncharacterized protein n=1 Tax=Eretmocerus hayati TaxID=131215 RepID=A0ACC2N4T2_9HYME|nr:hypothetical protein QAD02_006342 [Eretmocerus hayati]